MNWKDSLCRIWRCWFPWRIFSRYFTLKSMIGSSGLKIWRFLNYARWKKKWFSSRSPTASNRVKLTRNGHERLGRARLVLDGRDPSLGGIGTCDYSQCGHSQILHDPRNPKLQRVQIPQIQHQRNRQTTQNLFLPHQTSFGIEKLSNPVNQRPLQLQIPSFQLDFLYLHVLDDSFLGNFKHTFSLVDFPDFDPTSSNQTQSGWVAESCVFRPKNAEQVELSRYYIESRFPSDKDKSNLKYLDMSNLLAKPKHSPGLHKQISNMYNFSHKLPIYISKYVNFWEKLKNIGLWKDRKKTQIFIFLFAIGLLLCHVLGLNVLFFWFVAFR